MISKEELLEAIEMVMDDNLEDAHRIVQHYECPEACWFHAFLHRKEGDSWNANYWYEKAGRTMPTKNLDAELKEIRQWVENM